MPYDEAYFRGRGDLTHEVLSEVENARAHLVGRTVLDVGSGTGRHAHLLSWYGFEVSTTDLLETGAKGHVAGDFLALPFERTWENVVAFHFLEHVAEADVPRALDKMRALATRRVVVVVPHPRRHDYRDDATHQDVPVERLREAFRRAFPRATEARYDNVHAPPPWSMRAWALGARKVVNFHAFSNVMWVGEIA